MSTINFNNLRKLIHMDFEFLKQELLDLLKDKNLEEHEFENLQERVNAVELGISCLLCSYNEGDEDFKDLSDDLDTKEFLIK